MAALVVGTTALGGCGGEPYDFHCLEGAAPMASRDGSTFCHPVGDPLPAGHTWDPLGNRPLTHNCRGREWAPITHSDGREDCGRKGADLPPGWSFDQQ